MALPKSLPLPRPTTNHKKFDVRGEPQHGLFWVRLGTHIENRTLGNYVDRPWRNLVDSPSDLAFMIKKITWKLKWRCCDKCRTPCVFPYKKEVGKWDLKLLILEDKKGGGKMYFITKKGVGGNRKKIKRSKCLLVHLLNPSRRSICIPTSFFYLFF